jgi:hypothetical protein
MQCSFVIASADKPRMPRPSRHLRSSSHASGKKQLIYIFETDGGELRYVPAKDRKHNFPLKDGIHLLGFIVRYYSYAPVKMDIKY